MNRGDDFMREEATLEQWRQLYEVALDITVMHPWEEMYDTDIVTIKLRGKDEPYYFSILGYAEECYGIVCYMGDDSFGAMLDFTKSGIEEPTDMMIRQDSLTMYLGDRDEVEKADYETIKALGYKFRGKNRWMYFQSFKARFAPCRMNKDEVLLLTEYYEHLLEALKEHLKGGLEVDFEGGQSLTRYFSEDKQAWVTEALPVNMPSSKFPSVKMSDGSQFDALKAKKKIKAELELGLVLMPTSISDKKFDRPYFPLLLVLADRSNGMVIKYELIEPDGDYIAAVFGAMADFIYSNGKPKAVYVASAIVWHILENICEQLGIKLVLAESLESIDQMMSGLLQHLG